MSPTTSTGIWPPPGWITKKTAAERLNRSPERVAALAQKEGIERTAEKPLKSRKMESPETKQTVTLIHEGDVEAFIDRRNNPAEPVEIIAKKPNKPAQAALPAPEAADNIACYTKPPTRWLTIDEAISFSGLTRAWLLKEAESGNHAEVIRDMGKGAHGGRWRFLRDGKLEGRLW